MKKLKDVLLLPDAFAVAEEKYIYQSELTPKLDNHHGDFTEKTMLEIALWKTNRYPTVTEDLLEDINDLRRSYSEEKARLLLRKLLSKDMKGYDLPMASTVLRFAVPAKLQIIEQRVFRFITDNDILKIPSNIDKKIQLYFKYIRELRRICNENNIPFVKADRLLYQLDKIHNKDIPLKTYA